MNWETIRRVTISVVLAVYIVAAVMAGAYPSPLTNAWADWFRPAFTYLGLYHNYGMFAPDPVRYNQEFRALVKFKDGSQKFWKFPSLPDWKNDDLTRQRKLTWVEWECYFAFEPRNIIIVEDAARYVAWLHRNSANPPVEIVIFRDHSDITIGKNEKPVLGPKVTEEFLRYNVSEEDLK